MSLVLVLTATPAQSAPALGTNVDITAGNDTNNRQQVEPTIAVDPTNPSILVAGAQDYRLLPGGGHRWHGYYRSTDGGSTWTVSLLPGFPGDASPEGLASPLSGYIATSDPVLAFDNLGNVFYTGITLVPGPAPMNLGPVFVAKYTNHGATYDSAVLLGPAGGDKPWIAVDTTTNPHTNGNVYLSWDRTSAPGGMVFSRSVDHGATFSPPIQLPGTFPGIAVDAQGSVYVVSIQYGNQRLIVSKSEDAGASFETVLELPVTVFTAALPGNHFRVLTLPQIATLGTSAYVVWADLRFGTADVLLIRSSNRGRQWSEPIRVNDVAAGHQFQPTIAVAAGTVHVVWYDSRLDDGGRIEALDVFYARVVGMGRGLHVQANVRLTSVSFDPNLVLRADVPNPTEAFIGDYIHVAASAYRVHPIWADNRNACGNIEPCLGCTDQDVFTVAISVAAPFARRVRHI